MATEVRFIEAFEPVTDLKDKFTEVIKPVIFLNILVEVRFIEVIEPMTDSEVTSINNCLPNSRALRLAS